MQHISNPCYFFALDVRSRSVTKSHFSRDFRRDFDMFPLTRESERRKRRREKGEKEHFSLVLKGQYLTRRRKSVRQDVARFDERDSQEQS